MGNRVRSGAVPRPTSDPGAHAAGSVGARGARALGSRSDAALFRRGTASVSRGAAACGLGAVEMTRQRSFKRLVRARMEKTGESYTAARALLLAAEKKADGPRLETSDEAIRE